MAKVCGLVGSASGKIGNVVYAVINGIQTARAYQPNVANPKSAGQIEQRGKMSLVGRLSGITPKEALYGFSGNARQRRGKFVRNAVKATTYANNKASLLGENLILSDGHLPESSFETYQVSTHSRVTNIIVDSLLNPDIIYPAGYSVKLVAYMVNGVDSSKDQCQVGVVVPDSSSTAKRFSFHFPVPSAELSDYEIFVYAIPQAPDPETAGVIYSGLGAEAGSYVVTDEVHEQIGMNYGATMVVTLSSTSKEDSEIRTKKK